MTNEQMLELAKNTINETPGFIKHNNYKVEEVTNEYCKMSVELTENAINPKATSQIIPNPFNCSCAIPTPGISIDPNKNGPIKTPAIKYAVTAGNLTNLANLDNNNPANNAMDKLINVAVVPIITPSLNLFLYLTS